MFIARKSEGVMNAHTKPDDYAWWRAAVEGQRGEFDGPQCGYYRDKRGNRAIAISRGGDGGIEVFASSGYVPRAADELNDQFGFWCMSPISYEVFDAFCETSRWPEDVGDVVAAVDADAPDHERIAAEIDALRAAASEWLDGIGGKIADDVQNDKAANYAKRLADLAKRAEDTRAEQKRPVLEEGRKIDATWKPVVDAAEKARKAVLAPTTDYRVRKAKEIEAQRAAEEKRLREEAAMHAAETRAPTPPPVTLPPKPATGLRTEKRPTFTDPRAFLDFFADTMADQNVWPAPLEAELTKLARKWVTDGVVVPGFEIREVKVAR
jgi:hypothetical protein